MREALHDGVHEARVAEVLQSLGVVEQRATGGRGEVHSFGREVARDALSSVALTRKIEELFMQGVQTGQKGYY